MEALFLYPSGVYFFLSLLSSTSATKSSSRNSRTRRSWVAIATMSSSGPAGDESADVSNGVGGTIGDGVGVGLEGRLFGGAIGRVSERRFELRDVVDVDRAERVSPFVPFGAEGDIEADPDSLSVCCLPSREDRACCSVAVVLAVLSYAAEEFVKAKIESRDEEAGLEEPRRRHCCSRAIWTYNAVSVNRGIENVWNERQYEACVESWCRTDRRRRGSGLPVPPLWARQRLCLRVINLLWYKALVMLLSCVFSLKRVLEQTRMEQICN